MFSLAGVRRQAQLQRGGVRSLGTKKGAASSADTSSGFSSCLAFTPVQGIELCDPTLAQPQPDSAASAPGKRDYFASDRRFTAVSL